ncbi:hypothetical protein QR98_0014360 [Sarcoptes scabiei]|uniref:Uncharacterized protein n=1 Tax=Sarcoptes scabiei TaxID=52283 RepID=A0A131ZVW9_SARSC|nr:hypothetical protein QR98_0014360 [Sarcoptes scabiei]
MSNLNSVSIVSSSSNNIDQSSDIIPLSSLNTSALVRTISNGSTFGPLPSWSLGQSNCSDLANRSCFQNNPDHSNHFKPSNESGSSSNSNNNQVVGQSSSLCANNNIGSILATTFPAQNYPPVKLNLPLIFGENFILTGQIEASNLYRCIEMRNKEEYWCRYQYSILDNSSMLYIQYLRHGGHYLSNFRVTSVHEVKIEFDLGKRSP